MISLKKASGKDWALIQAGGNGRWFSFRHPVEVIEVSEVADLLPGLRRVEELVENRGLYAAGFISYEAAPAFDTALRTRPPGPFPLLRFGIYSQPEIVQPPPFGGGIQPGPWVPSITKRDYRRGVNRIKEQIARGETYQVNYTLRLSTPFTGDAWSLFLNMIRAQESEYGAFIDTGRYAICSASPELFFLLEGRHLTTRPMKGTAARGRTFSEDSAQAEWLYHSEKNRAENLMIVDMIRNDLGRIALTGSVRVRRLFEVERYPTVFQMTSTVTARTTAPFYEIVASLFPCASVTGAPKPRTMKIIAELEATPRRVYTGCIGFFSPGRRARFNVAIRTVIVDREAALAEYGVGGAIVWDSAIEEEYEECRIKARILTAKQPDFSLLETMSWTPEEGYFLLERHLDRLEKSASYFGFPADTGRIREILISHAHRRPRFPHKIRLLVNRDGKITCEEIPLPGQPKSRNVRIKLAPFPVDSRDFFLYHKTTNRRLYEAARAACSDCDDVLLWNERGEVTETTIANIVARLSGQLVTPPVASGLLPGTAREWLLECGEIKERVITIDEIKKSEQVFLINSVRRWQRATLLD
ncbi:MAG: aminodeoxychorismate synthase component I [Candidatus Euphemobacter frigidus]|nr:aminodeoxychorismate synthase component I [Candidatus Euphemobacter frigidus]MDP8276266.1 aminodeoxychorismate synthase component I [Candidatus Euphemobacter frigidus]